jgi:hypothetical protein
MDDLKPSDLGSYTRRCFYVFFAVICGTALMVAASLSPISSSGLRISLILVIAAVNATLVATFLMHIVTEKRFVLVVLAFTAIFFVALIGLSSYAQHDVPAIVAPR